MTEDIAVKVSAVIEETAPPAEEVVEESVHNSGAPSMAGNTPAMGWNENGMNPFMSGMFNFPNTMGMSDIIALSSLDLANICPQECPWGWARWQIRGCSVAME